MSRTNSLRSFTSLTMYPYRPYCLASRINARRIASSNFRSPSRLSHVRVFQHKTGVRVWLPLEDTGPVTGERYLF